MDKAKPLCGMTPWACRYRLHGMTYGIILYSKDPAQIEQDFADFGEIGVVVDGELICWIDND